MILNELDKRPSPTFYKTQKDLDIGLITTVEVLSSAITFLPKESDKFFPISYICSLLKDKIPQLHYINRNHIVEFFFKDLIRKVSFKNEEYIRYDCNKLVEFSEILHVGKPTPSLYNSPEDLNAALITVVHLLRDNTASLPMTDGYYSVKEICSTLKKRMPFLSYIDRNHIIELFFKDKQRKIIFRDPNYLKYKLKIYVTPPEILYFGTLTNLVSKMVDKGIFSSTKRYIKLYGTKEGAENFAKKFVTYDKDTVSVLEIKAKEAYDKGCRFSTYEEGEFIVAEVKKEFIKGII